MIRSAPKKSILAIIGPTASGKSDVAIAIAKKYNGEVISADSRQIYRGMTIGSGKVSGHLIPVTEKLFPFYTPDEPFVFTSENVLHWMIDIADPNEHFSAALFSDRAKKLLENILLRKKLPVLCGGTGYWAQSLIENFSFPRVLPNPKLRKELSSFSIEELFIKLQNLDPERAKTIDVHNPVRIIRSIEIAESIGKVPEIKKSSENKPYNATIIALCPPQETLFSTIEKRLNMRLSSGMIEEVQTLHQLAVSWKKLENFGLEYRWVARYLQNIVTKEEMRKQLLNDIRHYAKRQITWIRRWERMGRKIYWVENQEKAIQQATTIFESIKQTR